MCHFILSYFLTALNNLKTASLTFKNLGKSATVHFLKDAPELVRNKFAPQVEVGLHSPVLQYKTGENTQVSFCHLLKYFKHYHCYLIFSPVKIFIYVFIYVFVCKITV